MVGHENKAVQRYAPPRLSDFQPFLFDDCADDGWMHLAIYDSAKIGCL